MPAGSASAKDGERARGLGLRAEAVCSAAGYLAVFLVGFWLVRHRVFSHGWLQWLPLARQRTFLLQAIGLDLLGHVAVMSVPMLALGILLSRFQRQDPLRALGLEGRLCALLVGCMAALGGGLAWAMLLWLTARTGSASAGQVLGPVVGAAVRQILRWRELGWVAAAAFPAAVFSYVVARLLLPFGHLQPLLRRWFHPGVAALICALLFALPYLLTPAVSPLGFLNLLLLGLVLERLRHRTGSLWPVLLGFGGWVLLAELSGLPYQGMLTPLPPAYGALPPLLSGGEAGPEGGLLMAVFCGAGLLLLLVRRPATRVGETVADSVSRDATPTDPDGTVASPDVAARALG